MKKDQTVIILDLMGVLYKEGLYVTKILYPILKNKISYNELKKRYTLYAVGSISNKEFWNDIFSNNAKTKEFEHGFLDSLKLNAGAVSMLKRIRQRHKIILFSEIPNHWGKYLLKREDIGKYFDKILLSGDHHITKPYKKFFGILDSYTHGSQNRFYIDDTLENLIVGKKHGYITVWFSNSKNQKQKFIDAYVENCNQITKLVNDYDKKCS